LVSRTAPNRQNSGPIDPGGAAPAAAPGAARGPAPEFAADDRPGAGPEPAADADPPHRFPVEHLESCPSTNDLLLERARAGATTPVVLVAAHQSAGRGRRGAAWLGAPGASLAFSLLWRTRRSAPELGLVPLASGVACAQALAACGAAGIGLKWPNDLLAPGGKLGGILVESVLGPGHASLVIGIGINLRGGAGLTARLGRPVAALEDCVGTLPAAGVLLSAILCALRGRLEDFEAGRDAAILAAWSACDLLAGREVEIVDAGPLWRGTACGITPRGALRIRTARGMREVNAGETRVLPS